MNPYEPPRVEPASRPPEDRSTLSPRSVSGAVACLSVSAVSTAVLAAASWLGWLQVPTGATNSAWDVAAVIFLAWVTWKIAVGRGWARWVFIVVFLLGVGGSVVAFLVPGLFRALPGVIVASAATQFALQTAAMMFLLAPSSRRWFRERSLQSRAA
jgi:hypothetical protein